ncbi:MAG TPA: tetratricopeptide repeat protein [Aggregatilineaceae bacterium]|nr:tetratricopeptide repeat protein [Aggregatilineaceae bacterium]
MDASTGQDLADFDRLWDYDHPGKTEQRFRELLPLAVASGNTAYRAELLTQIARTLGLQQKFDEAQRTLDEVDALLADGLARPRIRCLLERGRVLNSSGAPDRARPLFVEAWEQAQQAGEDALAVDAAHMVAIVEEGQAALDWNLKALHLAETSSQERARKWLASLYNNIGWTYHDMGQYEVALDTFQKALRLRVSDGSPEPIRIARWCVARALRSLGRVEEALAMQQALLEEAATAGEKPGYTYEELGECLLLLDRQAEAAPYFAQAYAVLSQDPWLARNEPERLNRLKELGA